MRLKRKTILVLSSIILVCSIFIIIFNEYKTYSCENIKSDFIKDLCYLEKKDDSESINCYSVENTYLQYMCLRIGFRPHLLGFITTKFSSLKNDFSNLLEECKDYSKYHNLHCIYTNVASLAKDNLLEAKNICSQLKDEKLIGECKFYIASSIAMDIGKDTSKKIDLLMNLCKEISHISWRSECYYVLADELAMTKPEYFREIANACRKSNLAIDYACFDHVTYLMPVEKTLELCNILKSIKEKTDCFRGGGYIFGWRYGDIVLGTSTCDKFPAEYKKNCFKGLSEGIGRHFSHDIQTAISSCNEIPIEFRDRCFWGLGEDIGKRFNKDINSAISSCNEIPIEFRDNCFKGLCMGVGGRFDRDISRSISRSISACNKVPVKFRNDCFWQIGNGIGRHFGRDLPTIIYECNKVPTKLRNNCFNGVGQGIGRHFGINISISISSCNEIPTEFREDCFEGLGGTISEQFEGDIYSGISICNQFPSNLKASCFFVLGENIDIRFGRDANRAISFCNEIPTEFREDCFKGLENI